jgi:hypothetical protein
MQRTQSSPGRVFRLFPLLLLGLVGLACSGPPSDELQLRQGLEAMADALEQKERAAFMAYLSPDFVAQGRLRRGDVDGLLRLHFRQREDIDVDIRNLRLQLFSGTAELRFEARLSGTSRLLPAGGRWRQVRSGWRKEEGGWLLVRAEWGDRVAPEGD